MAHFPFQKFKQSDLEKKWKFSAKAANREMKSLRTYRKSWDGKSASDFASNGFDEFRVDIFHAIDTRNYSFNELIDGGKGGTIEKLLVRNHAPRNRVRLGLLRRR